MSTTVDVVINEKIKKKHKHPSKFKVIMLNDDQTPMEWVITILQKIFKHSEEGAKALMLQIHNEGAAVVGIYIYEIAEQKSIEATEASRDRGFPLQLRIEKD